MDFKTAQYYSQLIYCPTGESFQFHQVHPKTTQTMTTWTLNEL